MVLCSKCQSYDQRLSGERVKKNYCTVLQMSQLKVYFSRLSERGTVSKATWRKRLRDGLERTRAFLSAEIPL